MTTPIRIDRELYAAAQSSGKLHSRSTAQQIVHWARIGRALEASPAVTVSAVESVLAGAISYDDVPAEEQVAVRAAWNEQIATTIDSLNFAEEFGRTPGESWTIADSRGQAHVRTVADGPESLLEQPPSTRLEPAPALPEPKPGVKKAATKSKRTAEKKAALRKLASGTPVAKKTAADNSPR